MPRLVHTPTGATVNLEGSDYERAIKSGAYAPPEGSGIEVTLKGGPVEVPLGAPELSEGALARPGFLTASERRATENEGFREQVWGSAGQEVLTGVEGVLGGLTFGGSDWLFNKLNFDTGERAEVNPYIRLGSEITGAVVPGLLTGGTGFAASAARLVPSGALIARTGKIAHSIGGFKGLAAATALEGAAFGAGQAVSELSLHDVPLTSEAGLTEIGLSTVFGAGAGVVGGAAAYGLGRLAARLESKATARAGKNATEALDPFDIKSDRGREFVAKAETVTRAQHEAVEELFKNADVAARGVPAEVAITKNGISMRQRVLREVHTEWHDLAAAGGAGALDAETMALMKKAQGSRRQFNEFLGHKGSDGTGGLNFARVSQLTPEEQKALAMNLRDYEDDVRALAVKVGGPRAEKELAGRIAELQKNPRYRLAMPRNIPEMPEISAALVEAKAARTAYRQAFGITDDVLNSKALNRFAQMSPETAVSAMSKWTTYRKALDNLTRVAPSLGDDYARVATESLGELSQLTSTMTAPVGAGSVDIMTQLGLLGVAGEATGLVPDIDGPADELLKLYLLRRFLKRGGALGINAIDPKEAARAAREVSVLERGTKQVAGRAARFGGYKAGGRAADVLGVDSGVGRYLIRGKVANLAQAAISGGVGLGQATGKALARIEAATAKILKGLDRAKPAAGPTASIILNKARFAARSQADSGDLRSGDNLYTAFRKRSQEITQLVANPMATHQLAYDNLTEVRMAHPIVADRMEMKAVESAQFLYDKMPKDPGTMNRFGMSTWKPDESAIVRWANYVKAVQDPVGVLEGAAEGNITPQGAEVLRTLYPALFAEAQRTLAENAEQLAKNTSYDQRGRLSILFGVPVDSAWAPEMIEFNKRFWADRMASSAPLDPKNFTPNQPSPGQDLLSK